MPPRVCHGGSVRQLVVDRPQIGPRALSQKIRRLKVMCRVSSDHRTIHRREVGTSLKVNDVQGEIFTSRAAGRSDLRPFNNAPYYYYLLVCRNHTLRP